MSLIYRLIAGSLDLERETLDTPRNVVRDVKKRECGEGKKCHHGSQKRGVLSSRRGRAAVCNIVGEEALCLQSNHVVTPVS